MLGVAGCLLNLCLKKDTKGPHEKFNISEKGKFCQRGKTGGLEDKYSFLEFSCLDPLYKSGKADKVIRHPDKQAGRTAFPRSDVGLESALVR